MADLAKVLKGFKYCMMESDGIQDNPCADCPYLSKPGCSTELKQDAVAMLKSQQAEIERLKAQKEKWLRNIADQQLAVSPTGYETEEGLAKRTGEWNGLQMAWEILTKE